MLWVLQIREQNLPQFRTALIQRNFQSWFQYLSRSCSRETFKTIKLVQTPNWSLEWLHPHPKTTIFTGVFCCKSLPLPSELAVPLKPPLPQYRNPQGSLGWRSGRRSWHGSGSDDLQRFEDGSDGSDELSFSPFEFRRFLVFLVKIRDKLKMKLCWLVGFLLPKERMNRMPVEVGFGIFFRGRWGRDEMKMWGFRRFHGELLGEAKPRKLPLGVFEKSWRSWNVEQLDFTNSVHNNLVSSRSCGLNRVVVSYRWNAWSADIRDVEMP